MSLTRRQLGQIAAAGLASQAFAAKGSGVTVGVQSYSFRDRPLDEAIAAMKKIGLKECELWQGHVEGKDKKGEELKKWRLETPMTFFKEVGAKFKKAGIDLYAYNLSFRDSFSDEEIDRGFQMAKAMGAKAITASGNLSTVERVAVAAKKHKLKVGWHNHSHLRPNEFARPEDFEQAITGPGREFMAINLDIGHFTAANFDAVEFLKKHHARIVTLHIKDRKKDQGDNVPLGDGDTPIKQVLTVLRDNKWQIPANIEYEYKGGDPVEEVQKCYDYCRKALES